MSENIQSISQGTYTIGQTSAVNIQAGPGIKITEPSAGTVRIANDETVLFESANPPSLPISLSEAATNFERIRIVGRNESDANCYIPYKTWEIDTDSLAFSPFICLDQMAPQAPSANWDSGMYCRVCSIDASEVGVLKVAHTDSYAITKAGVWSRQSNDNWGNTRIRKVVGINRKEV